MESPPTGALNARGREKLQFPTNISLARKRLKIDGFMLLCVWPALNPLSIHVTFTAGGQNLQKKSRLSMSSSEEFLVFTSSLCNFDAYSGYLHFLHFLRASAMLKHVIDIVWTSVRPSVTRRYCIKTAERIVMLSLYSYSYKNLKQELKNSKSKQWKHTQVYGM